MASEESGEQMNHTAQFFTLLGVLFGIVGSAVVSISTGGLQVHGDFAVLLGLYTLAVYVDAT